MRILAISGSLRAQSSNSRLLRAAGALAPAGTVVVQFAGVDTLPHFNPDRDDDDPPAAVAAFRREVAAADALMICSPEYAHGVPGSLKNALDWLVGSGDILDKPIALINASARSLIAHASLVETLTVMSSRVIPSASITISLDGRRLTEEEMAADPVVSSLLRESMSELGRAVGNAAVPSD
jgi:chromate reductase, NAD(P)H dehydrogenase (quinone)